MIGTGQDEAPTAPLFRAFAEHAHAGGAFVGRCSRTAGSIRRY
jgi:hypothetical protein